MLWFRTGKGMMIIWVYTILGKGLMVLTYMQSSLLPIPEDSLGIFLLLETHNPSILSNLPSR